VTRPDPFAPILADPRRAAILSDFDGSLALIVEDPAAAEPLPGAVEILARLVARFGRVAVISGRPVDFLAGRLPVAGLELAGLHGMQTLVDGEVRVHPDVRPFTGRGDVAASDAEAALEGLIVERKGGLTCTVHWRTAPDREAEALARVAEIGARLGLVAVLGRMSAELRPPVAVDKGTAAQAFCEGMDTAVFAGDDEGDLLAFAGLERLIDVGRLSAAVRLAVRSPEAPPELLDRADERVSGPEELLAVFDRLADHRV
jgi:trehalose 6-phosphate phosphatase